MNHQMKEEMEHTIQLLQASMPNGKQKSTPFLFLMRIASSEMSPGILVILLLGILFCGMIASKLFMLSPMLVMFCTTPLPILLLFHRYILCAHEKMRELEETFRYSYTEMLAARTAVISLYVLGIALGLSLVLHGIIGEEFLRLALCGCVPSLYLCAFLLLLCGRLHSQDGLAVLTAVIWVALSFATLQFSFDRILQLCSTGLYALLALGGVFLYAICLRKTKNRRILYDVRFG